VDETVLAYLGSMEDTKLDVADDTEVAPNEEDDFT
jgi:hypothetical protein